MKKEEIEQELNQLALQIEKMYEKCQSELTTIQFLEKQSNELIEKDNNPLLTFEERELLYKQMNALHTRLLLEKEMVMSDTPKIEKMEERVQFLESEALNL